MTSTPAGVRGLKPLSEVAERVERTVAVETIEFEIGVAERELEISYLEPQGEQAPDGLLDPATEGMSEQSRVLPGGSLDSLHLFLEEISLHPQLQPREEVALARRIQRGDRAAWERLVSSNLAL